MGECPAVFVERLQVFAVVGFLAFFEDELPDESEAGCSAFVRVGNLVCRWGWGDVPDAELPATGCVWEDDSLVSVWQNLWDALAD